MAIVDVEDLRKVYDGRAVVDGVSFSVAEGEVFGILGPNGAGKTTTVECIAGLRRPDGGRIRVLGHDPQQDGPQVRRVLGAQLQESQLQTKLRVGEAIALHRTFYDDPADGDDLLELLGLSAQRRQAYGSLSGGQKQRLSIALALIGRPRVAVLDELTTGLDPQARRDTWALIETIRDTGVTILLVTHFMEEAERLCDRLAIIDGGRVVALDSPAGLIGRAANEQQLRFVPSGPLDERRLLDLPEVTDLALHGEHLVVTGTDDVVHAVVGLLAELRVVPQALRVEQQTLDDVFVALTGRTLERPTTDDEEGADR